MAKRRTAARGKVKNIDGLISTILPLFIITVCVAFSFIFTVMLVPLGGITADIKFIFIVLLVVSTTVASAVSLIFYMFFLK